MKTLLIQAAAAALTLAACATSSPAPQAAAAPAAGAKAPKEKNLALGLEGQSNNHIMDFVATNAFDGDTATYFEGNANEYPQTLTVDLTKKTTVREFVLKLNPKRLWAGRTQTIEVQSSADGQAFTTLIPAAEYFFDPLEGDNLVKIPVTATAQWFRLVFTSNTEATGGQLAEWEIH